MSVSKRLFQLFQSIASDQIEAFEELLNQGSRTLNDRLAEWERRHSDKVHDTCRQKEENFSSPSTEHQFDGAHTASSYPRHIVDDLQLFGLTPPSSLQEVKRARNSEIKIYHPDHYHSDSVKRETAKKILQIYNSAYERLRRFYTSQSG